jgi:carboxymethylenebutenolidase
VGRDVTFPSNGSQCDGYLAEAEGASAGIVVIQEWWGLVPHIKDVADRFAREGYVALAPDLYHGKTTSEPDEAMKMVMALQLDEAGRDMSGAVTYLRDEMGVAKVGCVGYCMGGALSLVLGTIAPVDAVVAYYGLPMQGEPDWSELAGPVQGHYSQQDGMFTPALAKELFDKLEGMGKQPELFVYDAEHGFFNDTSLEVHNAEAAQTAWTRTLGFFQKHLS